MRAYERDFTALNTDEKIEYARILEKEKVHKLGGLDIRVNLFREYPKAARHYLSLSQTIILILLIWRMKIM
ncbi:hypothetical protein J40TS1_46450 [Paenibacillus montaniterrae]|uniref:Uncharacterized protein n=1 Tax=Paenibacillus montaniterrae TaxID=429341 RepID=A0A919YRZ4_9BACL|nr:hypothetical protein [Paenibacillus montaniterrae]GIP19003.1 hypothetical protein J40TS1_46450 [Paenibacillus montaniterrae]